MPVSVCVLIAQSCPTLCDSMDYSLPGSSVHGILHGLPFPPLGDLPHPGIVWRTIPVFTRLIFKLVIISAHSLDFYYFYLIFYYYFIVFYLILLNIFITITLISLREILEV